MATVASLSVVGRCRFCERSVRLFRRGLCRSCHRKVGGEAGDLANPHREDVALLALRRWARSLPRSRRAAVLRLFLRALLDAEEPDPTTPKEPA